MAPAEVSQSDFLLTFDVWVAVICADREKASG
jgi:hypothetical protein